VIAVLLIGAVLAAEPEHGTAAATEAPTPEDARVTDLLVRINNARVAYLEVGLALVDATERQCTPEWAAELTGARADWDSHSDRLLTELKQPDGQWALPPSDAAIDAAQRQVQQRLEVGEAAYMERVLLMNQLMERCPEHKKALQGIYALGKHGFIIG